MALRKYRIILIILFGMCFSACGKGTDLTMKENKQTSSRLVSFVCSFYTGDMPDEEGVGSAYYYYEIRERDNGSLEGKAMRHAYDDGLEYDVSFPCTEENTTELDSLVEELKLSKLNGINVHTDTEDKYGVFLHIRYSSGTLISCEDDTENHLSYKQMIALKEWFENVSHAKESIRQEEAVSVETFQKETGLSADLSAVTEKEPVIMRIKENGRTVYTVSFSTYEEDRYVLFVSEEAYAVFQKENVSSDDSYEIHMTDEAGGEIIWQEGKYWYCLYMSENPGTGALEYMRLALRKAMHTSS